MYKKLLILLLVVNFSCLPARQEGYGKMEATYMGYYKIGELYVLQFKTKTLGTIEVQQFKVPHFRMRDYVYLEWDCPQAACAVRILKNK